MLRRKVKEGRKVQKKYENSERLTTYTNKKLKKGDEQGNGWKEGREDARRGVRESLSLEFKSSKGYQRKRRRGSEGGY